MLNYNLWTRTTLGSLPFFHPIKKEISSKRVFKIKTEINGIIDKYKARLVARGFTQIHGFNNTET